jgi:hypothetical protein
MPVFKEFCEARKNFKKAFRANHKAHHAFLAFKTSKEKWQYFNCHVKTKNDKSSNDIGYIHANGVKHSVSEDIGNAFNDWFSNIQPNDAVPADECLKYVDSLFQAIIRTEKPEETKFRQKM